MMADLRVEQHPDKTFIGRIARGFDFLGYWFTTEGLGIASKTVERFAERVSQLYEQGAGENRIAEYVRRWGRWVRSGVDWLLGDGYYRMGWGAMLLVGNLSGVLDAIAVLSTLNPKTRSRNLKTHFISSDRTPGQRLIGC